MARFGDAEIVSGSRATAAEEAQAGRLAKKPLDVKGIRRKAAVELAKKQGLPVYESGYSRLIVQIASPRDLPDANGRVRTLPGIRAKFNFGLYTPMSALRRGTKEHTEEVALIIEAMESHPKFGLNKLFWRADEMMSIEREAHYQEAVKLLEEDEELKSRFLAAISAGEIDSAVAKTQAKRKDVIAAARGSKDFVPVDRQADTQTDEEKDRRSSVMERAERAIDKKAKAARANAEDEDLEDSTGNLDDSGDVLAASPKKKKKKRRPLY